MGEKYTLLKKSTVELIQTVDMFQDRNPAEVAA